MNSTNNISATAFKRGISPQFITALNNLKQDRGSFWHRMINDPELFIGIRNNYINVYYHGQSLCKLKHSKGNIKGKTHKKYLGINESGYVESINGNISHPGAAVSSLSDLEALKGYCIKYKGREKEQSYKIINDKVYSIIDVEVTFPGTKRSIDYLALEGDVLVFYEAKHTSNAEIRARDHKPRVLEQLKRYEDTLRMHRQEILDSYNLVLQNRLQLGLISSIPERLEIDPWPRLIIFDVNINKPDPHLVYLVNVLGNRLMIR